MDFTDKSNRCQTTQKNFLRDSKLFKNKHKLTERKEEGVHYLLYNV